MTSLLIEQPSVPEIHRELQVSLPEESPAIAPPVAPARDEIWWRATLQEARDNLKRAEDEVVSLQLALSQARLGQLETTSANEPNRLAGEIVRLTRELSTAQREVTNARRYITELEEDLKQSGLPVRNR